MSDRSLKKKKGKTNIFRFKIKMNSEHQNPVDFINYKLLLRLKRSFKTNLKTKLER